MNHAQSAGIAADHLDVICAAAHCPVGIQLKVDQIGIRVFHDPVHDVLAFVFLEFAEVVVVVEAHAEVVAHLCRLVVNIAAALQMLKAGEIAAAVADVLCAQLRMVA